MMGEPGGVAEEDLKMFARILLHLGRQPRFQPGETVPPSLTQAGIAAELGKSQPAVSNALLRLVSGGAVEVHRAHVAGKSQRLKAYQLTPRGEAIASHIRESMERFADEPPTRSGSWRTWDPSLRTLPE